MPLKQIVILADDGGKPPSGGGMTPLGRRKDIIRDLASYNTSPAAPEDDVLHGPGIRIEIAPGQDPVTQMLLTIDDEDIAWVVILRLARIFHWKLLDPVSGRELRAH
ncbi:MAG: hypothetical protein HRU76_16050 [Phycisphaeraceae bacterium]|nr:hypothetical protein [Phycisphaerales bacterium]QOJ19007.1 MAG: hypothetical protein HRU76_16050 [Phycisphaeraceae bacterium]